MELSEERKAAERLAARVVGGAAAVFLVIRLLPMAWDKLSPFIIAIPLAAALQPVIRFLQKRLKLKRSVAALIPVLLGLILFLTMTALLLFFGSNQVISLVDNSPDMVTELMTTLRGALNSLMASVSDRISPDAGQWIRQAVNDVINNLGNWGTRLAGSVVSFSVSLATSLPYLVIYISFLAMAMFFISKDYDDIRSYLPGGTRHRQDSNTSRLTHSAIHSLIGYLKVQGTFGVIVWIISWICLTIFGFPYAWLIAIAAGVLELIPMIGSGLLYFIWAAVAFILGDTTAGLQVLFLTLGLQLLRRVLEPKLMSDSIGISPLLSLMGMFVGMRFGGIPGLIGGPVLMAVLVGAVRGRYFEGLYRDAKTLIRYFKNRWR